MYLTTKYACIECKRNIFHGCISSLIIFLSNYITDIIRTLLKNNAFVQSKSERLSAIKSFYAYYIFEKN